MSRHGQVICRLAFARFDRYVAACFGADGVSDFDRLRASGRASRVARCHVRRATLRSLIKRAGPGIKLSEHLDSDSNSVGRSLLKLLFIRLAVHHMHLAVTIRAQSDHVCGMIRSSVTEPAQMMRFKVGVSI